MTKIVVPNDQLSERLFEILESFKDGSIGTAGAVSEIRKACNEDSNV